MFRLPNLTCKNPPFSASVLCAGLGAILMLGFCSCRSPYCAMAGSCTPCVQSSPCEPSCEPCPPCEPCVQNMQCGPCSNPSLRCETRMIPSCLPRTSAGPHVSPRCTVPSCRRTLVYGSTPACAPKCVPTCTPTCTSACTPACGNTPACAPVAAQVPNRNPALTPAPETAADSVLNDPQIPVQENIPKVYDGVPEEAPLPESSTPRDLFAEPSAPAPADSMMKPVENRAGMKLLETPEAAAEAETPTETPTDAQALEVPDLSEMPPLQESSEELQELPEFESLPSVPSENEAEPQKEEELPETLNLVPAAPQTGKSVPVSPVRKSLKKAQSPQTSDTMPLLPMRKNITSADILQRSEPLEWEVQQVSYTASVPAGKPGEIQLTAGEEVLPAAGSAVPAAGNAAEAARVPEIPDVPSVLSERPKYAQPADEYIVDSNHSAMKRDLKKPQKVKVGGVEMNDNVQVGTEDQTGTFMYYDGVEGRTTVQSPEPVYIYAPRFRAVRQVVDLNINEQVISTGDVYTPTETAVQGRSTGTDTTKQHVQAGTESGRAVMIQAQGSTNTGTLDGNIAPQSQNQDVVAAQESRINVGPVSMDGKTHAWTTGGLDLVNTWTKNDGLQVFIDRTSASASVRVENTPSIYSVKEGTGKQDVKIYKVSSQSSAKPGETVDFVIYFENTGHAPVGHIVLVDSLPARLEIIEDSAESSVDALFSYEINNTGSQTLRWEVTQPLYTGEKGAVKFKALVR